KTTLLVNGCSMCYGSELFEDSTTKLCIDNQARLAASWSGLLGKQLGFERVVNLGYPGGSNDRILRTTMAWILNWLTCHSPRNTLCVIIGWSGPMRREFYINDEWRQLIPYHDYADASAALLNRAYREIAWSEYESAIRFSTQLLSLQSFLQQHKIPYLFFDAITSFAQINEDSGYALNSYLPHILKQFYFNFNMAKGDMASQLHTIHEAKHTHPNQSGHLAWAQKLATYINDEKLFPVLSPTTDIIYEGTGTIEIYDKKIGLPPVSPQKNNFARLDAMNEIASTQTNKSKNIWLKLKKAFSRDPFIYE
ncbi:MAG: hypothetical protein JO149_03070, partial [Gammaproteobacteria bacterium]|nr:hypothetical protein [Gammaproteobacteria bacterium]